MKIVQSFWSKPFFSHKEKDDKSFGGWRDKEYFFMSWALSCLTFSKFYKNVELITDANGYELVKKMKLPYTSIKVELDCLNNYPQHLWAIGKLYAYSIQKEPFIHVDNDVYIWERMDDKLNKADLIAQNVDLDAGHYSYAINQMKKQKFTLLDILKEDINRYDSIKSCNAGLLGGNNLNFIHNYCKEAFKLINSNVDNNSLNDLGTSYAIVYEQYLFSCLARKEKIDITYYIEDFQGNEQKPHFDITNFKNKYYDSIKYSHMIGSKKKEMKICYELRNQLEVDFPEYLDIIEKHINDRQF